MAVKNIKNIKPFIWIPPVYYADYRITVTDSTGVEEDITDISPEIEVNDSATESIGDFKVTLWNNRETYTGKWKGGEVFKYYKDYSDQTPSTCVFTGLLEKPSKKNNTLVLSGRRIDVKYQGRKVTESFSNTDCSDILKTLITNYGDGTFTSNNVQQSGVNLTVAWYDKPFWECVQDLCKAAGFDVYCDSSKDWHFHKQGSDFNTTDAVVHTYNLFDTSEFVKDTTQIINRVLVYGAQLDNNIQVMYTAESNDPDYGVDSPFGAKESKVSDDNITSYDQAKDYGDFLLNEGLNPPEVGELVSTSLLATIRPGQSLQCSDPQNGIQPGNYLCIGYSDKINSDGLHTTVHLTKRPRTISHIFKEIIETQNSQKNSSANPASMRYAYTFTFDTDSGTHTNTEIVNGVLRLQSGQTSGIWVSNVRQIPSNLNSVYNILNGINLTGVSIYVSGDSGITYEQVSDKRKIYIAVSKGTNLRIKVVFNDATTEIDSLNMMYNLD